MVKKLNYAVFQQYRERVEKEHLGQSNCTVCVCTYYGRSNLFT